MVTDEQLITLEPRVWYRMVQQIETLRHQRNRMAGMVALAMGLAVLAWWR